MTRRNVNKVTFTGRFMTVHAYTDCSLEIDSVQAWKHLLESDMVETTFLLDNRETFFTIRVPSALYEECKKLDVLEHRVRIEGYLKTEVSRGIGFVNTIIYVNNIARTVD